MILTCTCITGFLYIAGVGATLTRVPSNQGVLVGGSIRLNCSTADLPLLWRDPGRNRIIIGSTFQADTSSLYDIFATNVGPSYCGTYTCVDNSGSSASADVVVFNTGTPQCQGVWSDSYASATCNVSYCGNSNDVQLNIQQNGNNLVSSNSKSVTWTSPTTNSNTTGITCTVAAFPGITTNCKFPNVSSTTTPIPTSSPTTVIIILSVIGGVVLIVVVSVVVYIICRRSNPGPFNPLDPSNDSTEFVGQSRHSEVGSQVLSIGAYGQFANVSYPTGGYHRYGNGGSDDIVARASNYHSSPVNDTHDPHVAKAVHRALN